MTHQSLARRVACVAIILAGTSLRLSAQQKCPAIVGGAMPLAYSGGPTVADITACDLMTRLYIYAADSMRGREAGTPDAMRATAYIEAEVRRLGLKPAGDNGTYFQNLPVTARVLGAGSSITSGSTTFKPNQDFSITALGADRKVSGDVIFAGALADTSNMLTADQVRGKVVLVTGAVGGRGGFGGGRGGVGAANSLSGAVAILTVVPAIAPPRLAFTLNDTAQTEGRAAYNTAHPEAAAGRGGRGGRGGFGGGQQLLAGTITSTVAAALLGKSVQSAVRGDVGAAETIDVRVETIPAPTRNVVAIIPGSDPKLRGQYVVIGAHSDHVGMSAARPVVEHDSLKAYNIVARVEGADTRNAAPPTAEQWARINAIKDSLRKIYPARPDSISNGADDDGSGSVSILEIAEAFARGPVKPKRSLIFIWQMGEEKGLWGSQYFTNHPTVSLDSIVADLNLDMVGRGEASDVTGRSKDDVELTGAANYVQLVGSRRLSTELGDIAEDVSTKQPMPFKFDYAMDANGHPQNIYCRSDHANYARYGIPVIFFTTGGHADYHQVTDEPEYIQYQHMARVDKLVFDIATRVANLDHRVKVDGPKANSPFAGCQQ
ncbi:MAG TPA: M28 family peptidase [Gemmatimonadaceae bacterium]|nr:M28 family peptidase [Gemmatimonadaceae bacterium]